ncbi:MAG: amidohydrolase family protein [Gammaproteobacteria bacterium]
MWRNFKIVSDDSHFEGSPDMWRPYVAKEFQQWVPKVVDLPTGGQGWLMPGSDKPVPLGTNLAAGRGYEGIKRYGISYADPDLVGAGDGAQRLAEMDRDGIDSEILYPPVGGLRSLYGKLPRDAHVAVAQGYNDWLSRDYTAAEPHRMLGLAMLPPTTAQDAVDEMKRVQGKPGIYGVVLHQWPNGGKIPSPEDDLFWKAAQDSGMPLTFHIAFGGGPETEVIPENELNWAPINTLMTRGGSLTGYVCTRMINCGMFDRFPDLRFSIAESGAAWVPYYRESADSNYLRHRHWAKLTLPQMPSYYINKHFLFGIQDDYAAVRMRNEIGVNNLTWGSDFPHTACDWPHSDKLLDKMFEGVPEADARRILGGNLAAHLKIDLDKVPAARR